MGEEGKVDLEKDLRELEKIVEQLENEKIDLDKSIDLFERGVKLAEEVKGELSQAEARLKKVVEESDMGLKIDDFNLE
ncbi:MAG: exodeoxyribonuclease VII small subunit [Candidatus Bipolaricaulota bacterium]